ncbi:MAG: hypothetical protein RLZZ123_375 [Pseudomonadota bacterium]|jgi:hypothetical protein
MSKLFILVLALFGSLSVAHANGLCETVPAKVQNINVSYIDQRDALQELDDQLLDIVNACLDISSPERKQAACKNGRVAAEQVLRVIGRIDQAAKHNDFLKTAKLKSYKLSVQLLERSREMERQPDCRR